MRTEHLAWLPLPSIFHTSQPHCFLSWWVWIGKKRHHRDLGGEKMSCWGDLGVVNICLSPMIVYQAPYEGQKLPRLLAERSFSYRTPLIISVVLLWNTRFSSSCWMGQWIHREKTEVVNFVKVWESDEAGWAQQNLPQRWHVGLVLWKFPLCFPFKGLLSFPSFFLVCARHCGKFMVRERHSTMFLELETKRDLDRSFKFFIVWSKKLKSRQEIGLSGSHSRAAFN